MEKLGMYYGFAIYMTSIVTPSLYNQQTTKLSAPGVRDRAIVFVDKVVITFLYVNITVIYFVGNDIFRNVGK